MDDEYIYWPYTKSPDEMLEAKDEELQQYLAKVWELVGNFNVVWEQTVVLKAVLRDMLDTDVPSNWIVYLGEEKYRQIMKLLLED